MHCLECDYYFIFIPFDLIHILFFFSICFYYHPFKWVTAGSERKFGTISWLNLCGCHNRVPWILAGALWGINSPQSKCEHEFTGRRLKGTFDLIFGSRGALTVRRVSPWLSPDHFWSITWDTRWGDTQPALVASGQCHADKHSWMIYFCMNEETKQPICSVNYTRTWQDDQTGDPATRCSNINTESYALKEANLPFHCSSRTGGIKFISSCIYRSKQIPPPTLKATLPLLNGE